MLTCTILCSQYLMLTTVLVTLSIEIRLSILNITGIQDRIELLSNQHVNVRIVNTEFLQLHIIT